MTVCHCLTTLFASCGKAEERIRTGLFPNTRTRSAPCIFERQVGVGQDGGNAVPVGRLEEGGGPHCVDVGVRRNDVVVQDGLEHAG